MANSSTGMLCDYGSSADNSADESQIIEENCSNPTIVELAKSVSTSSADSSSNKHDEAVKRNQYNIPKQYRDRVRKSSSLERSSTTRSKRCDDRDKSRERYENREQRRRHRSSRSRSRSYRHHRSSHRKRHRRVHDRRSSSDERHRHRERHKKAPSKCEETGPAHKIVGSISELAKAQGTVKPVDPVAARLAAANKASVIMASAVKSTLYGSLPSSSTPQEVLARIQQTQMAQVRAKAEAAANAANLPKFYNPLSVNAAKLAEQQQKRKLLWSKKADSVVDAHEEAKCTMWKTTSMVAGKGDTAAAAKFRKLMGIHDSVTGGSGAGPIEDTEAMNKAQAQAQLFQKLEQEYEMSRTLTHTQRGVGLGYSSAVGVDYAAYAAMRAESHNKQQGEGPGK